MESFLLIRSVPGIRSSSAETETLSELQQVLWIGWFLLTKWSLLTLSVARNTLSLARGEKNTMVFANLIFLNFHVPCFFFCKFHVSRLLAALSRFMEAYRQGATGDTVLEKT